MRHRAFQFTAVLAVLALVPVPAGTVTTAPRISRILGSHVGVSTVESLERTLGPGAVCVGGHANGGRAWFLVNQRIWVYADGFDYGRGGRVIDTIRLGASKSAMHYGFPDGRAATVPNVRANCKALGWLGRIVPGMAERDMLKRTKSLPKPKAGTNGLVWSAEGMYVTSAGSETAVWKAEVTFGKGVVSAVEVWVDGK